MMNVRWLPIALCLVAICGPVALVRAAEGPADVSSVVQLLELVIEADADAARECLKTLGGKIRSGEVEETTLGQLKERLAQPLAKILADSNDPLAADAALLAALWNDAGARKVVRAMAEHEQTAGEQRQQALATLVFAKDPAALAIAAGILGSQKHEAAAKRAVLAALSRSEDERLAATVLSAYADLGPEIQPLAIELLTQRAAWSKALVAQIAAKKIPASALNVNQVRKLAALGDAQLTAEVARHWGTIREGRDPAREQLIGQMRGLLAKTPGDPHRGVAVFEKLCGQCHKIHGQGQEVGPDITANGRASFEQLLSNVFDPSLVIGASYQARMVRTTDGRVITGLLVEEGDDRIVLKVQGGKLETIGRDEVEAMKVSELSLMPEGIEKQLQPQEIADLFAFITLDRHPADKSARRIPGTPPINP